MAADGVEIEHPNRKKASSKVTRMIVVVLLLASALVMAIISLGAWDQLVGAKALQVIYILLYVMMAYFVARWSRGVLPVAAALAIVLRSSPWSPCRAGTSATGRASPTRRSRPTSSACSPRCSSRCSCCSSFFAMRGFQQAWNVEVEHPVERGGGGAKDPAPAPA